MIFKGHTISGHQAPELSRHKTRHFSGKAKKSSTFSDAALVGEGGFELQKQNLLVLL